MSSISQVSEIMQTILTSRAKALERETGFVERSLRSWMERSLAKPRC